MITAETKINDTSTPIYPVAIYERAIYKNDIKNIIKFPFNWYQTERHQAIKELNSKNS